MWLSRCQAGIPARVVSLAAVLLCKGAIVLSATVQAGSPKPFLRTDSALPSAKQAIVNRVNSAIAQRNPDPIAPDPAPYASMVVQACTRDLSLLVSGLTPAHSMSDFPAWASYSFTNEWVDPSGSLAVQAGYLPGSNRGLVTVEQWSAPTACSPSSGSVYLAPDGSGSFTIASVSDSTVSLDSSAGTTWTFELGADTFQQVS
jgi:hypothetical protein